MKKTLCVLWVIISFVCITDAELLYYDGQESGSVYSNTSYSAKGMNYTYPNGMYTMSVTGGRRLADGSGAATGDDVFDLNPSSGDSWDQAGLFDAASGTIGGGSVEGVMYISFLVRAHYASNSSVEYRYFGLELLRDSSVLLGLGNGWQPWAWSIYGDSIGGTPDLLDGSGDYNYTVVDNSLHLMVARIAFHSNTNDDISVWLDPDPVNEDDQAVGVYRYIASAKGDFSFNRFGYTAGNDSANSAVDYDEVRFGTDWASVTPGDRDGFPFWYDGQTTNSTFSATSYDASGLTYTMANGSSLSVTGGKRTAPGDDIEDPDTISLGAGSGSIWDQKGYYDSVSGLIGGGSIQNTLYFSVLIRSQNAWVSGVTEPTGAYFQLNRPGTSNNRGVVSVGTITGWSAYSITGLTGSKNLEYESGGGTYIHYNTSVHMMVGKIEFNADADDSITIWMDPNPDNEDAQASTVRRASGTADLSFSQVGYRSGDLGAKSSWDFDEVRFATSWYAVVNREAEPIQHPAGTLVTIF